MGAMLLKDLPTTLPRGRPRQPKRQPQQATTIAGSARPVSIEESPSLLFYPPAEETPASRLRLVLEEPRCPEQEEGCDGNEQEADR